jgi:hypothetical protein
MAERYRWYEVVNGADLEQGDLLFNCPVLVAASDVPFPIPTDDVPGTVLALDVIILTQSCDLAQNKISEVILCPHSDLADASRINPALSRTEAPRQIINGYRPRYTMLSHYKGNGINLGTRIVDFGRIYSLPKPFVSQVAADQGQRLRLCPPYREHLSQSFARFFMRVGLPLDIELPK